MSNIARRHPPSVRALWLGATALQLLLPGAAAWADARLDAAEAHAVAHIESHTTKSCARIHPPDCALCHFLTAPGVTSRATVAPPAVGGPQVDLTGKLNAGSGMYVRALQAPSAPGYTLFLSGPNPMALSAVVPRLTVLRVR